MYNIYLSEYHTWINNGGNIQAFNSTLKLRLKCGE